VGVVRNLYVIYELRSLAARIQKGIREQGRYYVSAPAEMMQLGDLRQATEYARLHDWMLVSHIGGDNYEFFEAVPSPQQVLFSTVDG